MTLKCTMILGDCLDVMPQLKPSSADQIFCDLPYQCTANKWDINLDLSIFSDQLLKISSDFCASLFTCTTLFASQLIASIKIPYRYDLVWHKSHPTGFLNAKRMPLRAHELVLVFYQKMPHFSPIMSDAKKLQGQSIRTSARKSSTYSGLVNGGEPGSWTETGYRYPTSVLSLQSVKKQYCYHPTQKPVALLDWLIRTYSNEGSNVFDPTAGSFTTCVAACSAGRNSVGIERDERYFEAGVDRVRKHIRDNFIRAQVEVIR